LAEVAGATVRTSTINPTKAALPAGVEVFEGYIGRLATLPAARAGVEKMYLVPFPRTVREVVRPAKEAGVRHIGGLSCSTVDEEEAVVRPRPL
jgi:hypothetical protein